MTSIKPCLVCIILPPTIEYLLGAEYPCYILGATVKVQAVYLVRDAQPNHCYSLHAAPLLDPLRNFSSLISASPAYPHFWPNCPSSTSLLSQANTLFLHSLFSVPQTAAPPRQPAAKPNEQVDQEDHHQRQQHHQLDVLPPHPPPQPTAPHPEVPRVIPQPVCLINQQVDPLPAL